MISLYFGNYWVDAVINYHCFIDMSIRTNLNNGLRQVYGAGLILGTLGVWKNNVLPL